jgi:ribose/xylose/arabinose/galactoside ABC-type transport system permease subunit
VIGGTTFAGGEGGIAQTTIGVVLLACLLSLMVFFNAGISGQLVLEGTVILGAVWLQSRGREAGGLARWRRLWAARRTRLDEATPNPNNSEERSS